MVEILPFDLGVAAYRQRVHHSRNPYTESEWQHNEWWLGWNDAADCDELDSFDWKSDSFKKQVEQEQNEKERIAARFERLTPAQQEQARLKFEDAHAGDGYRYQSYNDYRVDPEGKIIIRHVVGNGYY